MYIETFLALEAKYQIKFHAASGKKNIRLRTNLRGNKPRLMVTLQNEA